MPNVKVYDMTGKEVGEISLSEKIFGAEVNASLLHSAVRAYLLNQRQGTQSTKTRSEVSGGGKKPWRQKGTGRARQGSTRSPQWYHGGIAHGPKPRSYRFAINKNRYGALNGVDNYTARVPLIRLSEMCYIAAEVLADSNPRQAISLLNTVRNHRNLGVEFNLSDNLTAAQIKAEIKKEYLKEFLSEGQLFYYYKRLGDTDVLDWVGAPWTDDQFVFPMPESELTNGGRQQLTY